MNNIKTYFYKRNNMKLPLDFKAEATTTHGINTTWSVSSSDQNLTCAIPPEFNGPGGGLSPEDLFAQALTNCLVATFKVYAENSKLTFSKLKVLTDLTVDLNEAKKTIMKKCHFNITVDGSSNSSKTEILIKKAFESGFILNSVKTELTYNLQLNA